MRRFEIIKYQGKSIGLCVYGGFATEEQVRAITETGWVEDMSVTQMSKVVDFSNTSSYVQVFYPPRGTAIFGGHTKEDEKEHIRVIRKVMANFNIYPPLRKGDSTELF